MRNFGFGILCDVENGSGFAFTPSQNVNRTVHSEGEAEDFGVANIVPG
jgi:hypothetical protein